MPQWCCCSVLSLTDHCSAAQSSPAASLGYHLPALCPTAHCPHSSAAVPSSPPQPQCQGHPHTPAPLPWPSSTKAVSPSPSSPLQHPHCLPHHKLTALCAHSTGSSVSAPLILNCCSFPPRWLYCLPTAQAPTSPSSGHSPEPYKPLCRAAPQCLPCGLGEALLWFGLSCTPSLPLLYPCVHTLHPCAWHRPLKGAAAAAWGALGGHWMNWGCDQQNLVLACAGSVSPSPSILSKGLSEEWWLLRTTLLGWWPAGEARALSDCRPQLPALLQLPEKRLPWGNCSTPTQW